MTPFPVIPPEASLFFVSDAYSIDVQPGNPFTYHPGIANMGTVSAQNKTLFIYLTGGEFVLVPPPNCDAMFNVDVDIELYDVSGGGAVPTGLIATWASEYGYAPNGKWLNASANGNKTPVSRRDLLDSPVLVRIFTPPTGGPWAIGARLLVFSNLTTPRICHYSYFMQGAWRIA